MNIGERIKRKREELNMSQDELARKLGYKSRSSINKIERDASGLPQNKIAAIAAALDTTPSYIMGWEGNTENIASFHAKILKDIPLMEMIEEYYKLSAKNQKVVRDLVRSLAASEV